MKMAGFLTKPNWDEMDYIMDIHDIHGWRFELGCANTDGNRTTSCSFESDVHPTFLAQVCNGE